MPLPKPATEAGGDNLAMLYQGVFTVIVRLQAGRHEAGDPQSFSKLMENLFQEIRKQALKLGYTEQDVADATAAVTALLQETLNQTPAGPVLRQRLAESRARGKSRELTDLLEVYYLCLLLARQEPDSERSGEELRQQIEEGRGRRPLLSQPEPADVATTILVPPAKKSGIGKGAAVTCLAAACASWIAVKLLLNSTAQEIVRAMVQR